MTDEPDVQRRLAALEARVQELEDDRAIRELLGRYGYTADTCKDDAYVDLYADDGVLDITAGAGVLRWEGKEQLRDFIAGPNSAHHQAGFYGNSMHVTSDNLVTRIDGDEAVAASYSIVVMGGEDGVKFVTAGNNWWAFEKVDGRWRIKLRRRRQIGDGYYVTNLDEVGGSLPSSDADQP